MQNVGGNPINLDVESKETDCSRCGERLAVTYDVAYGERIVEGVIERKYERGEE